MDLRLAVAAAAVFAAVVAAGGWNVRGGSTGSATVPVQLVATVQPSGLPNSLSTPAPRRNRDREDSRGPAPAGTPGNRERERDD